jgi:hypothetical protein
MLKKKASVLPKGLVCFRFDESRVDNFSDSLGELFCIHSSRQRGVVKGVPLK